MNANNGGAAFPYAVQALHSSYAKAVAGMTLRDWFAGQESLVEWDTPDAVPAKAQWRAALKYIRADAMIVARENETTS